VASLSVVGFLSFLTNHLRGSHPKDETKERKKPRGRS